MDYYTEMQRHKFDPRLEVVSKMGINKECYEAVDLVINSYGEYTKSVSRFSMGFLDAYMLGYMDGKRAERKRHAK